MAFICTLKHGDLYNPGHAAIKKNNPKHVIKSNFAPCEISTVGICSVFLLSPEQATIVFTR